MTGWLAAVGPALRLLRKSRGLRQNVAAERAGLSSPALSAYERSRRLPSLRTLAKLLDALDARLVDLGRFVEHVERAHR